MAIIDSTRHSFRQRLLAVLDYDEVPQNRRVAHLVNVCGCAPSTARRWLSAGNGVDKMRMRSLRDLARGMAVARGWLVCGELETLAPRTLRIHIQQIKGYPKSEVDRMMRLFVAWNAGQSKAVNLMDLVVANKLTVPAAARLF